MLRRPHLAGKLDPENVSGTLSAGLPSLDATLVADVARSFDDLEATQQELHDLRSSLEVVERFLPVYVEHLVHHVRLRAQELIDASSHLRRVRAQRATEEAEHAVATERVVLLATAIDDLRNAIGADEVEVEAILASKAYQAIGMLDEVGKQARSAHDHAHAAEGRVATAEGHLATAEQSVGNEQARLDAAQRTLTDAIGQTRHFAERAGLDADAGVTEPAVARAFVAARRSDVAEVRTAIRNAERTAIRSRDLATTAQRAQARRAETELRLAETRQRVDAERHGLRDALASWARASGDQIATAIASVDWAIAPGSSIAAPPLDDLIDVMAASLGAEAGLELAARNRIDPLRRDVADLDGDAARRRTQLIAQRDELAAERERVSDEPNPGPPIAATRPDAAVDGRAGAPLYACVDFAPSVPNDERAGWEAALHAAGLLDARLFPDGRADEALDAALTAKGGAGAVGSSLAELLVAVPCNGVEVPAIEAVLRSIAIDDEILALNANGHWRLGPLSGRFTKPAPEFIGHEARERRRAERLRELGEQIAQTTALIKGIDTFRLGLSEIHAAIDWVLSVRPSATKLEDAVALQRDAFAADEAASNAFELALAESERAAKAAESADGVLRALAVRHRLGVLDDALDAVADALRETERAAGEWQHAIDVVGDRTGRVAAAVAATDARRGELEQARVEWRRLADDAEREGQRLEVLRTQVGAEAEAAARDLEIARERRERHHREQEMKREDHTAELADSNRLAADIERLDGELVKAGSRVESASTGYAGGCTTEIVEALRSVGIAAVQAATTLDSVAVVRAARGALDGTTLVADGATDRMMKAYQQQLLDGLRAGYDPQLVGYDDIAVVRVHTVDGLVGIGRLVEDLRAETAKLASLLSDRERQIFETHLLTRVSEALRDLLLSADEFETSINQQMAATPTESGMRVELKWEMNVDRPGMKEALGLLRYSPEMLGPDQREQLRSFFASSIATARASDPGRSFAETLTEVLDYRNWHRFVLYARFGDGQRRQMTRVFFRGLSGGEAATVLHLPLFAAAAAHYSTCRTDAPRLIALDEAFVGIDERMRGRLMGLLVSLDLDVLLTSHEFWGAYAEVPELVVYDLMRRPPAMGVSAQQFTWRSGRPG